MSSSQITEADNHPHYANPVNHNHLDKNGKVIPDEIIEDLDDLEILEMMGYTWRAVEREFVGSNEYFHDFCRELIDDKDMRDNLLEYVSPDDITLQEQRDKIKHLELVVRNLESQLKQDTQDKALMEKTLIMYSSFIDELVPYSLMDEHRPDRLYRHLDGLRERGLNPVPPQPVKINYCVGVHKLPDTPLPHYTQLLRDAKQNKLILAKNRPRCKSTSPKRCRRKAEAITSEHANTSSASGYEYEARKRLDEGNYWWDFCKKCYDAGWVEVDNDGNEIQTSSK